MSSLWINIGCYAYLDIKILNPDLTGNPPPPLPSMLTYLCPPPDPTPLPPIHVYPHSMYTFIFRMGGLKISLLCARDG